MSADVAFDEILNRIGKMRPDGDGSARERYEGHRQDQHQFPCADRSDGGAAALISYRARNCDGEHTSRADLCLARSVTAPPWGLEVPPVTRGPG